MGSVGDDKNGKKLEKIAKSDGVNTHYELIPDQITGTCAVLLTGINRSLCAYLGAANHFSQEFFNRPQNIECLNKAKFFYISVRFYIF